MQDKKRIIVIEDDAVLRDILSEKLEKSGYVVDSAPGGVVALEKIRAVKPDCIILDILMPLMSGIEVLEKLRADEALKDIPVIIISNSSQPLEIKRAQELGARAFLSKDIFGPNEVLEKVRGVLAEDGMLPKEELVVIKQDAAVVNAVENSQDTPISVKSVTTPPVLEVAGDKIFVLVIEDDKFLRELLVRKLAGEGFDVKNAIDSVAAFAILEQRKPNIILLDLILPGVDGFEILAHLKADPKVADVPVIILSNLGQKEDLEKAMALGAKDFMVKANFTLDEIADKVRAIVG